VQLEDFGGARRGGGQGPGRFVDVDFVWEGAGDDGILAFDAEEEGFLLDVDDKVFALIIPRELNGNIKVADCLSPFVGEGSLFCFFLRLGRCLFLFGWFYSCTSVWSIYEEL